MIPSSANRQAVWAYCEICRLGSSAIAGTQRRTTYRQSLDAERKLPSILPEPKMHIDVVMILPGDWHLPPGFPATRWETP